MKDEKSRAVLSDERAVAVQVKFRHRLRTMLCTLVMALCLAVPAWAGEEGGGGGTSGGISSVMSAVDTVITLCNKVWTLMAGNPYLAVMLAVALLGVGVGVFRRIKWAAIH